MRPRTSECDMTVLVKLAMKCSDIIDAALPYGDDDAATLVQTTEIRTASSIMRSILDDEVLCQALSEEKFNILMACNEWRDKAAVRNHRMNHSCLEHTSNS